MNRKSFLKKIALGLGAIAIVPLMFIRGPARYQGPKALHSVNYGEYTDLRTGESRHVAYMLWPGDPPIVQFINHEGFYGSPHAS